MTNVLLSEGRCSSRYHICEWNNFPDDPVCILLCRLISDDMITMETVCHCGGCIPLVVTMCH
jgi:hypothetical protein